MLLTGEGIAIYVCKTCYINLSWLSDLCKPSISTSVTKILILTSQGYGDGGKEQSSSGHMGDSPMFIASLVSLPPSVFLVSFFSAPLSFPFLFLCPLTYIQKSAYLVYRIWWVWACIYTCATITKVIDISHPKVTLCFFVFLFCFSVLQK